MRSIVKAILKKSRLDGFARELYGDFRTLYRKITGVDKKVIEQYLDQQKTRKLHLGCGDNIIDGWLNSDISPESDHIISLDMANTIFISSKDKINI